MPQKRPPPYKDTTLSVFNDVGRRTDEIAACSAPAEFTEADLAALAAAVDIGLRDAGNAVELPGRKAALARLMEVAAETFAPKRASDDRVSAPVSSACETAGEAGAEFGGPERGSLPLARHSAGTEPNIASTQHLPAHAGTVPKTAFNAPFFPNADPAAGTNHQEDIEMTAKLADTSHTTDCGDEARPEGDAGGATAGRISPALHPDPVFAAKLAADPVFAARRAANISRFEAARARACGKAAESSARADLAAGRADRPAGESAALRPATGQRQATAKPVYSAPSYRRSRA